MRHEKPNFINHILIALCMVFISFMDFIYRALLPAYYSPILSLFTILLALAAFISLFHRWLIIPYASIIREINRYYKDLTLEAAVSRDSSVPYTKDQINSLEDLIGLYQAAQKQQLDLVCQLTNTNHILDQNNKFANAIVQITGEILRSKDIQSILQLILNKAVEIIPNAQKGSILLYNNDFLEFKAMAGYNMDALKNFKFNFNEIFQYNADDLYEPIVITDVEDFNRKLKKEKFDILKETRSFELKSCISCAISVDNQFYGIINIDNTESCFAFVDEHKPIIKYFAEQIGIALKNAQQIEKILYMSQYDSLTGVCNRAHFEDQLQELYNQSKMSSQGFTLVVMDMNDLKYTNDNYGHEAGDQLIVTLISYISGMEQQPEIFGRVGGDEFALVYKNKSKEQIHDIIHQIRCHFLENPFVYNNQELLRISFGYGLSCFPEDGMEITQLFKNADRLMYLDKKFLKEETIYKFN